MEAPEILNADEMAQYLDLSKQTIYKLIKEESMPHYRAGKSIRFNLEEVLKWLEENK